MRGLYKEVDPSLLRDPAQILPLLKQSQQENIRLSEGAKKKKKEDIKTKK
jgi:hypothetical protein